MTTSRSCQRWTRHTMSWQYAEPGQRFTGRGYDVQDVDYASALAFLRAHHYLASMGADVKRYGLFHHGELVGVAVYGNPSNRRVLTNWLPELEPYRQSLALLRVAMTDSVPGNGESWFLRACRERLTAAGVLGTVTFADPMTLYDAAGRRVFKGHAGIMYQGDNWTYCGVATARPVLLTATGQRLDARTLQKIRGQESGHEAPSARSSAWALRPCERGSGRRLGCAGPSMPSSPASFGTPAATATCAPTAATSRSSTRDAGCATTRAPTRSPPPT